MIWVGHILPDSIYLDNRGLDLTLDPQIIFESRIVKYHLILSKSINKRTLIDDFRRALAYISDAISEHSQEPDFYKNISGYAPESAVGRIMIWSEGYKGIDWDPVWHGEESIYLPIIVDGGHINLQFPFTYRGADLVGQFNRALDEIEGRRS